LNADGKPSIMRLETTKEGKNIEIPPFVTCLREVTDDNNYASKTMAMESYK
jgi:CYTH domain-containing protein